MNRQVIASRLQGLSEAFKESAFRADLLAMSDALNQMDDSKYATLLAKGMPIEAAMPSVLTPTTSTMKLWKILDSLFKNAKGKAIIDSLPSDVKKRIEGVYKKIAPPTGSIFKWASEEVFAEEEITKEALFGLGKKDPLEDLVNLLDKYESGVDELRKHLSPEAIKAFHALQDMVHKELEARPKDPTPLERGKAVFDKAVEKGKEIGQAAKDIGTKGVEKTKQFGKDIADSARGVVEKYQEGQRKKQEEAKRVEEQQTQAVEDLRIYFKRRPEYSKVYYSLPFELRGDLEKLGLTPDELKEVKIPPRATKIPVSKPVEEKPLEAPKTEAPKTEAPKAEAPKAEAPKPEAIKPVAPKVEPKVAPKTEAPKIAPKQQSSKKVAPVSESAAKPIPKVRPQEAVKPVKKAKKPAEQKSVEDQVNELFSTLKKSASEIIDTDYSQSQDAMSGVIASLIQEKKNLVFESKEASIQDTNIHKEVQVVEQKPVVANEKKMEKEAGDLTAYTLLFDGIELVPPMDEISL